MDEDNDGQVLGARRVQQVNEHERQEKINNHVLANMEETLRIMRSAKPSERDELARRYAVAITEYEKSLAFFKFYVIDRG